MAKLIRTWEAPSSPAACQCLAAYFMAALEADRFPVAGAGDDCWGNVIYGVFWWLRDTMTKQKAQTGADLMAKLESARDMIKEEAYEHAGEMIASVIFDIDRLMPKAGPSPAG